MKNILLLYLFLAVASSNNYAQVGIGTPSPDPSALLDVFSQTKGLLMPRLTMEERDAILVPANGLMIYNTTTNDGELNTGTTEIPVWKGLKNKGNTIHSVTEGDNVSTTSLTNTLIPGMTIAPDPGSYLVMFNAQISTTETVFSTDQGVDDVDAIYSQLINLPNTDTHPLVFGNDEILTSGVYGVLGAASIAGKLTLDGEGDPNALFVIKSIGAFSTGAGTEVILINGASANNVFWLSEGAASTAANTILKGTLLAHAAAVSLGANTNLEGRMFSTAGTVTMGATSYLYLPTGASPFNLGVLSSFVMFTSAGAISGCADCGIIGNVGTGIGAATLFESINGTVYLPGTTSTPNASITTYSIYKNGEEVINSSRSFSLPSSNITLQSMATVLDGESIEIRWKVDSGKKAILENRILSLIRSY